MSNNINKTLQLNLDKKLKAAAKAYNEWNQYLPYIMERLPGAVIAVENGRIAYNPSYQRVFVKGMKLEVIGADSGGFFVDCIDIENIILRESRGVTVWPLGYIPVEAIQDPEYYSLHIAIEYEKHYWGKPNEFERLRGIYRY